MATARGPTDHAARRSTEIWVVADAQPRRRPVRHPQRRSYHNWRKNRQPNAGLDRDRHGHQPQLRLSLGLLRRLEQQPAGDHLPRASACRRRRHAQSATSSGHASSAGIQQIGWPSPSTASAARSSTPTSTRPRPVPSDMAKKDHKALVALPRGWRRGTATPPMQGSHLYITAAASVTGRTGRSGSCISRSSWRRRPPATAASTRRPPDRGADRGTTAARCSGSSRRRDARTTPRA